MPMAVIDIDTREKPHQKYERLLNAAKQVAAATTVIVHPCDETSLRGVVEAQESGLSNAATGSDIEIVNT
jgi:phosphate acetyltransferase